MGPCRVMGITLAGPASRRRGLGEPGTSSEAGPAQPNGNSPRDWSGYGRIWQPEVLERDPEGQEKKNWLMLRQKKTCARRWRKKPGFFRIFRGQCGWGSRRSSCGEVEWTWGQTSSSHSRNPVAVA